MSQRGNGYDSGTTVDYTAGEMPDALRKAHAYNPKDDPDSLTTKSGMKLIINEDGSVDLDLPAPAVHRSKENDKDFGSNLAESMDGVDLPGIALDYLEGVEQDTRSRTDFIGNWTKGVNLLGLKIEEPSSSRGNRESISKVRSAALLKACVRSQSLARGQLLPADGPVKVAEIGGDSAEQDELARDLQADFNYYMTEVAKEYYPDTDRALFWRAFGGSMYKKVFRCPLRRRPVSDAVQLDNFIVSEEATSLTNAIRKTHESQVSPVTMRRMQLEGGWLDVPLAYPQVSTNQMSRAAQRSQGLQPSGTRPGDVPHTVYEGYWYIDPAHYGIDEPGAPAGLPLPYRVTIDKDSKQVLALHRNWKEKDDRFVERQVFVKFGLVPGLGFLDYGYLHLIGNQTRVLTAIQQILIDKGMLSNFPGGFKAKGIRTTTNELNPGMGEFVEVDLGQAQDIRAVLMGMPYGTIDTGLIQMFELVAQEVEAMSGTVEIETGGSRTNTPVGTILAMVEQQTQDLTAVHQRDHRAQKEELGLLRQLFVENPEDLKWMQRRGKRDWSTLIEEFTNADLMPASDPNVPSQAHRIMLNQFIMELAKSAPALFAGRERAVGLRVMESTGINDADSLLASQEQITAAMQQGQQKPGAAKAPDPTKGPELQLKAEKLALDKEHLQVEQANLQRQAANEAEDHRQRDEHHAAEMQVEQTKLAQAERELQQEEAAAAADQQPTAEDDANLRALNARAFASMGAGAMGFAKAAETVQSGEEDLANLDDDLSTKRGQRKTATAKRGGRAKR